LKTLALALALYASPLAAQFEADVPWIWPESKHWHTQVGHGVAVGVASAGAGLICGSKCAKLTALGGVLYYTIRETRAHASYRHAYRAGTMSLDERRKLEWDSNFDVAYPVVVAAIPLTWERKSWFVWGSALALTWIIADQTDPGGVAAGMY
jgi:hypothetical protein